MSRFIDPFTDTGFKIIFGKENKSNEILKAFLNDLFEGQPDFDPVEKLHYLNNERSHESLEDRAILYDIVCETQSGHRFIVEMQRQPQPYFFGRSIYYVSRAIYEQGLRGIEREKDKWDYGLLPVIGVFFCDFHVRELGKELVQHVRLCDTATNKPVGNLMRYAFIQLPMFRKKEHECLTEFDKWIYILKNMSKMQTMPFTSHRDIFERLASVSNVAALTPDERRQYDYDVKKSRDYHAEMGYARATARAEGLAEGRAEGLAEGRAEGRADEIKRIASNMKHMGISVETIESVTGLSVTEIDNIQ